MPRPVSEWGEGTLGEVAEKTEEHQVSRGLPPPVCCGQGSGNSRAGRSRIGYSSLWSRNLQAARGSLRRDCRWCCGDLVRHISAWDVMKPLRSWSLGIELEIQPGQHTEEPRASERCEVRAAQGIPPPLWPVTGFPRKWTWRRRGRAAAAASLFAISDLLQ